MFGQVIDGMDVVDSIATVETNSSDKPTTDVVIDSIEVTTYKAQLEKKFQAMENMIAQMQQNYSSFLS